MTEKLLQQWFPVSFSLPVCCYVWKLLLHLLYGSTKENKAETIQIHLINNMNTLAWVLCLLLVY